MRITITEALAESKLIKSKIQKKQEWINQYIYRQGNIRDPFDNNGGTKLMIKSELQSINDLEQNLIKIRNAINVSNLETVVDIAGIKRSIAEWLIFRRELLNDKIQMVSSLLLKVSHIYREASKEGIKVTDNSKEPNEIIINIDQEYLKIESERLQEINGKLDAQLSLLNATTFIEI